MTGAPKCRKDGGVQAVTSPPEVCPPEHVGLGREVARKLGFHIPPQLLSTDGGAGGGSSFLYSIHFFFLHLFMKRLLLWADTILEFLSPSVPRDECSSYLNFIDAETEAQPCYVTCRC